MRKRNFLVAGGACLAALILATPLALANPTGDPPTRILAGMGSLTTADLMNDLSNVPPSGFRIIGSYDVGGLVQTKIPILASDCVITLANGSANGVRALRDQRALAAAPNPVRRPCLDFSRSSVNQSQLAEFAGTGLTWVPFASDKVTFVTRRDTLIPRNLTVAQLRAIYLCTAPGTISTPPTILPLLPQSGSDVRARFLQNIGVAVPGPCVSDRDPTNPAIGLIESTGNRLTDPRHIVPHTVSSYLVQLFGTVPDVRGGTELRKINEISPFSATFPFSFDLYNVIPTRNIGVAPHSTTFVGSGSAVCSREDLITRSGFWSIGARCGEIRPENQTPGGLGPDPGPPTN